MPAEILAALSAVVSASTNLLSAHPPSAATTLSYRSASSELRQARAELLRVQAERDALKGVVRRASLSQHANRHAPHVKVVRWETRKDDGVTEYVVEASFGCGPPGTPPTGGPIYTKHRFSDFKELHKQFESAEVALVQGPFPVKKKWFHSKAVKDRRVGQLNVYIAMATAESTRQWAARVTEASDLKLGGSVFVAPLQEFLDAKDIDDARLK
jgi:hypothetical protein